MIRTPHPSQEEVLSAFAVEPDAGRRTLERYLRAYPQYAEGLVELSRERWFMEGQGEGPLSGADEARIEAALGVHRGDPPALPPDPLAALSVPELRQLAQRLAVPRQVITAFRERRVIAASVPRRFLADFADALRCPAEALLSALGGPPPSSQTRSYKSEVKPEADQPVTFERLLLDAGLSAEARAALLAEGQ
jgi:hypothetical protein